MLHYCLRFMWPFTSCIQVHCHISLRLSARAYTSWHELFVGVAIVTKLTCTKKLHGKLHRRLYQHFSTRWPNFSALPLNGEREGYVLRNIIVRQSVTVCPADKSGIVMGRCRYLTSVSVFGIFVGIFSSRFGIRYRYSKISRYRFGISVFQLVHFKGHR